MSDAPSNWPPPPGGPPQGSGPPGQPPQGWSGPSPGYGAPQPGPPQYGTPPPGAPQYGAPQPGPPQYGAPQYGAVPPAYAPPKANRSVLKGCLIAAGIFVVLALLGIGGCAVAIRAGVKTLTAPVDASNQWLDALDGGPGERDRLTSISCPSLRGDLGEVRRLLEGVDWTGDQNLTESNIVNGSASVQGTIDTADGERTIALSLSRASGDDGHRGWCVDGVTVG